MVHPQLTQVSIDTQMESLWFPLIPSPVYVGLLACGLHHCLESLQLRRIKHHLLEGHEGRISMWRMADRPTLPNSWALRNFFPHTSLLLSFCQKDCDPNGCWSFPTALRNISHHVSRGCLGLSVLCLRNRLFPSDDDWQLEQQFLLDIRGTCAQGTSLARPLEKNTQTIGGWKYCLISVLTIFVSFYGAWNRPQRKIVDMILITQGGHVADRILNMFP